MNSKVIYCFKFFVKRDVFEISSKDFLSDSLNSSSEKGLRIDNIKAIFSFWNRNGMEKEFISEFGKLKRILFELSGILSLSLSDIVLKNPKFEDFPISNITRVSIINTLLRFK